MVVLQTFISRRVGEKTYFKSIVTIPRIFIKDLEWRDDQELFIQRFGENKLILAVVPARIKQKPLTYQSFAATVKDALMKVSDGLTWTQIREISGLSCKRPNPLWVHRLENDLGLERKRDKKSSRIVWKLPTKKSNDS